jgi:hypothetical protein
MAINTSEENARREQLLEAQTQIRLMGIDMDNLQQSFNIVSTNFQRERERATDLERLVDACEREISKLTHENHRLRQLLEAANVSVIS